MCLILFAYRYHPCYPLIVAGNRDEFHARPAAKADFWPDNPQVLAGRDLEQGGTWLGVTGQGRFAALTNYRDPARVRQNVQSRGFLVSGYLTSDAGPQEYIDQIQADRQEYNGFNLLLFDRTGLWHYSNQAGGGQPVGPGIHGVSNHLLDTPWPKVAEGKTAFQAAVASAVPSPEELFQVLADRRQTADAVLPDTGVGVEWERLLSSRFIVSESYGTRASTLVLLHRDGQISFYERSFTPDGRVSSDVAYQFDSH